MDPNRLTDLRDKLEMIRAKRGDVRPTGPPQTARSVGGVLSDRKTRFIAVGAILAFALYYLY
jgi:hypothetical protein